MHRSKPEVRVFAAQVTSWLRARGVGVCTDTDAAIELMAPDAQPSDILDVDFLITLGGDGTILRAARLAAPRGVPILGVHMGRFGFIAETHPTDLFGRLETILAGSMPIEERMMVRGEVWRGGTFIHSGEGLNEVLIKTGMSRLMQMRTTLGGSAFANYPADGLIISTPTGSTAYALSAGGPLVAPTLEALCITPICPHTLAARPLLLPADETIEVQLEVDDGDVIFTVDTSEPFGLASGDTVIARRSDCKTRLIAGDRTSFYRKVRDRYVYGERLNR
jgi:NAD+ kinase